MGTGTNPFVIPANTQPLEVALLILRSGAEKIRICCTTDTSTFCDTTGPPFGGYPKVLVPVFPPACCFPPPLAPAPRCRQHKPIGTRGTFCCSPSCSEEATEHSQKPAEHSVLPQLLFQAPLCCPVARWRCLMQELLRKLPSLFQMEALKIPKERP